MKSCFTRGSLQPRLNCGKHVASNRKVTTTRAEAGRGGQNGDNQSQGFAHPPNPQTSPNAPASPQTSPHLGNRLLNVGPNAPPSAVAAALAANKSIPAAHVPVKGRPLQPPQASASDANPATSSGGYGNGSGTRTSNYSSNGNGNRAPSQASGPMIAVSELDSMLHGLRASLASIQESRAQYVQLLAERDATITELQSKLSQTAQKVTELERQLRSSSANKPGNTFSEAQAEELESRAAAAEAKSVEASERAAEADARAAEMEAYAADVEARAAKAEARAAKAEAMALVTQELLQQQSDEISEAKAVAERLAQAQAAQQQAVSAPPPRPTPAPQRPAAEVVLTYRTGWKQAFLHCSMDGKGWTNPPGLPMESVGDSVKMIRLPCTRVEFVINNGKNDWDSIPGNYHVSGQGSYKLENGQIQRVQ